MDHHFNHSTVYEQHFPHHQTLPHHRHIPFDTQSLPYGRQSPMIAMPTVPPKNETKPRLGKEEVEILEREFQKNPKPTTNTKKQFAEQMSVDLSRINNWFQNRRAKRKQEKKQEAYEAGQVREALGYRDSDSPPLFNPNGFYDNGNMLSMQQTQPSYTLMSGPPPATAPYNPQYSDPATASLQSLERTIAAAQAISHQEFHEGFVRQNDGLPAFGGPLVIHTGPSGERASFPAPGVIPSRFVSGDVYDSGSALLSFDDSVQPIPEISPSPVDDQTSPLFTGYPISSEPAALSPESMNAFTSQLLPAGETKDAEENEVKDVLDFTYDVVVSNSASQSPPAPGQFRSPPPPMDIAARRPKVQQKPAALGMDTIRSRPQLGPRTVSQAEQFRRPLGSPSSSPMRRIASAGGSNCVMSGRIQKSGIRSAQRSPIDAKFFEAMERNCHSTRMPPSLTVGSSLNSSLAPPTPMSPMEAGMMGSTTGSSSSPESNVNFLFPSSVSGNAAEGDNNCPSPPETPAPNAWFPPCEYKYNLPDEAIFTPANDEFPMQFPFEMPPPGYLSSVSQPVTPAFGGDFTQSLLSQHESPQYTLTPSGRVEYTFPDSFQHAFLPGASPQLKQKTFQFSNSTPADFTEK